jgi:pimeloyl-ACP methyl ester carboxylesterase
LEKSKSGPRDHRRRTESVKLIWGEQGVYIKKEMGEELAKRAGLEFEVLPNIGHYPHLQSKETTIAEVRGAFDGK